MGIGPKDLRWMRCRSVAMMTVIVNMYDVRACSCSKSFSSFILFNPHNNLVRSVLTCILGRLQRRSQCHRGHLAQYSVWEGTELGFRPQTSPPESVLLTAGHRAKCCFLAGRMNRGTGPQDRGHGGEAHFQDTGQTPQSRWRPSESI